MPRRSLSSALVAGLTAPHRFARPDTTPARPSFEGCAWRAFVRWTIDMPTRARLPLVAFIAAATAVVFTMTASGSTTVAKPYFVGNFDTCNFSQWNLQGPSGAFQISRHPRTEGRCAAVVSVGPAAFGGLVNQSSDGAALWTDLADYGTSGHQIWQHFSVLFMPNFKPTDGAWNWFAEWHNDGAYQPFIGHGLSWEYPNLCWSVVKDSGPARISMRLIGGPSTSPSTRWISGPVLKTGHWYDFVLRVVWSPDPKVGRVSWWLDGDKLFDGSYPTLYTRPDGSVSRVYFVQDYYRLHADWTSSVAFDGTVIGPTRDPVGYPVRQP